MKNELISILITNFNKEKFLKNCLNSVYRQNLKNFEIILFDYCSNDNSLKIIKKNKRIKLILNKKKISEQAINHLMVFYQVKGRLSVYWMEMIILLQINQRN